jgi:RNA polymerase sigma-70 factor (ECF subfamily)
MAAGWKGSPGDTACGHTQGRACLPWSEVQAQDLLRAVAAGDPAAFEQLYRHYAPHLAAFLRRRLGNPALANEVLHDVMLVVWQRAALFRPTGCVSTWLFGIAWYKARKARKSPLQLALPAPVAHEIGSHRDNPEHLYWQWERSRLVAHALESLPPEQRTVVELTYYHACSAREIAQRLEEAESTVRSRLRLARQRLAHCLARQGLGPLTPP